MAFLNSMGVDVFPITNARSDPKSDSHYLREYRLTDWISSLLDKKSFVVSKNNNEGYLEFVIDGYYFKVQNSALSELIESFDDVYAYAVKYDNFIYV